MITPRDDIADDSITDALIAPTPIITTVSSFIAISWYNALAVNVVIFLVFKRWGGLYFYSLLIASWGIVLHQLGYLLQFFSIVDTFAKHYVIMMIGWYAMTTGQAVVLYSRLHLITRDQRKFRWVLYMITNNDENLIPIYNVWQNIQVTAFSIQEFILAGLYIYEARKVLKPSREFRKAKVEEVMRHLIYVNILVIFLDIAVMCTQYAGMYEIHVVFKGAVYGVKLFVEFFILNQLTEIARHNIFTEDSDPSTLNHHGTGIGKHASITQSRTSRRAAGLEGGEGGNPPGYFYPRNDGLDTPAETASGGQLSRTSETDMSRLVNQPPQHVEVYQGDDVEQAHVGVSTTVRRRDEWIELN
ncbi:hypothetical protein FQN54_009692 [Arachnomyces sp. PD_36]|nr:hypothetical protein FQN54_009692 [Arachnomyces sp. PD_36]